MKTPLCSWLALPIRFLLSTRKARKPRPYGRGYQLKRVFGLDGSPISIKFICVASLFISFLPGFSQTVTESFTSPGNFNFTVPAGVTSVTVQCWGAGGGGSGRSSNGSNGGGGGGGGGFRGGVITVSAGDNIDITVGQGGTGRANGQNGTDGEDSRVVHTSATITANGGAAGTLVGNNGTSGAGGQGSFTGTVTSQVLHNGGNGGNGDGDEGGAGGGGAGSTGNGANGDSGNQTSHNGGNGGNGGGGDGGDGGNDGAGQDGESPGGGGGASGDDGGTAGDGGNGQVIITYDLPAQPRTYYSRNDGNWNATTTWSLSGHNGGTATGVPLPATGDIVLIGGSDDVTIPQGYNASATSVTISDDNTTSCILYIGDNTGTNAAASLTLSGDIEVYSNGVVRIGGTSNTASRTSSLSAVNMTLNGTSTFTIGNTGNVTNTATFSGNLTINSGAALNGGGNDGSTNNLNLAGNLVNNGTVNFYNANTDVHNLNFEGNGNISGSSTTTTVYNLNVTSGTRTFGDASNGRTLDIRNDLTISTGAAFQSGSTGAQSHTVSLRGNLTNNGTLDFTVNNPANQFLTFTNNTAARTISGSGTFTLQNLTLEKTGTTPNVTVNATSNIAVKGDLNFASNSLLIIGANSNLVLGTAATITGYANNRYIQLDGATGSNSNLIKVSDGTAASWQFTFPIGTATGGYTPVTIPAITDDPDAGSTLAVKAIYNSSQTGQLRRSFRLTVAGNDNGTTFSNAVFSYSDGTDISSGDAEADYTTAWRSESGTLSSVASSIDAAANTFTVNGGSVITANLNTGTYFYTIGRPAARVWYSYQNGNFNDFNTWTLDPSGTTFDNGLSLYPANNDEIHILNGYTVTFTITPTRTLSATEIKGGGILDMATSTGNNLGVVTGAGLLRVKGTALPGGLYTDFVATTGGTIEYYDVSGTLSATQTEYNKLKMTNSTGTNIIFTLASNMTVNGTFDLSTTGSGTVTWQINNTSNTQRTITLYKDLNVAAGGRIIAGTGNSGNDPHDLILYGNFTNNGIVQFFDPGNAPFTSAPTSTTVLTAALRGNAVNVTFSGMTDQTVTCNNQTDFYRFIVNKGSTQQAMVTVYSTAASNMRLFGPADLSSVNAADPDDQVGYSSCALSIINGTLQLTGTLTIPTLIEEGGIQAGRDFFKIPITGCLWLNSPGVHVTLTSNVTENNDDQRLMVNGLFRVSNGSTFHGGVSRGIGAGAGGTTMIEGTNTMVTVWQFRPLSGGTEIIAFTQTGGTFNVGYGYHPDIDIDSNGNGVVDGNEDTDHGDIIDFVTVGYARFDLGTSNCSFTMTGGTMNVAKATDTGGFIVSSGAGNYSVTGGTINFYVDRETAGNPQYGGDNLFVINSTAPLHNVNVYQANSTQRAQLQTNNLIVQNDFKLIDGTSDPTFSCSSLNLSVGGDFDIQSGTTFNLGTTGTGTNTITFNGSGAQIWTHNGTISNLTNVVVDKVSGTTLTLAGGQVFPEITGATTGLTLTSGTLDVGNKTITVTGALSNSAIQTGSGVVILNGATTIGGNNGTFGNFTIQTNNTVATSGNQTITGTLRLINTNTSLNISSYALAALGNIYSDNSTDQTFSATKRIITSGLHNAGGLTRQGAAGGLLFPLGTGSLYTPNTIDVTASTHGTITVRPVNSVHPNATTPNQSLHYYWRVTSTGYAGITAVTHKSYAFSTSTKSGTQTAYRSARFDAGTFTWTTGTTTYDASSLNVIPDFNTGTNWTGGIGSQLDGEYTCGFETAFGAVVAYYSKSNGAWGATTGVWTDNSNHTSGDIAGPPCSYCPVIIGNGTSINHKIDIDANSSNCGTLSLNAGSTLDCGTHTGLNLGTNTTGTGTLRIGSPNFPAGDFINFLGTNGGTVEWYITSAAGLGLTGTLTGTGGISGVAGPYPRTFTNISPSSATGSGSGALFTIVFSANNTISSMTVTGSGSGYASGNVLTFNGSLFGGTGSVTRTLAAANISYTIPSTGPSPQSLSLATYYNLVLNPAATFTILLPASNLTVYNNWTQQTGTGTVTNNGARTLAITNDLTVSAGTFNLTTGNTTIAVGGDVSNSGTFSTNNGTHTLSVTGGLTNNNALDFYTPGSVALTFTGSNDVLFDGSGSGGTTLYTVTVNKGTSQTPTVTFSTGGAINTTAMADGWLKLQNGTFDFANTGTVNTTLSSSKYTIPSTAKLKVSGTQVTVNTTNTNATGNDLFLNGTLEIAGGTVNVGSQTGTTDDVDIEYASAGSPTLIVSNNATLWVRSSIRRSTAVLVGTLIYNQSGNSVVTVGGIASNNTRGVFEIDNIGSSFTLTGTATLNVERQTDGTGTADIYLNPSVSNVSSTSTITIGLGTATDQDNLRVYMVPTIGNFSIRNGNGHAQEVFLYYDLSLSGTLTIPTPSVLNAATPDPDANVTLAGNFDCTGTYNAGTNTTTFNGATAQSATLSANTHFYDVTVSKTSGTVLTLSGTAPTAPALNNLSLLTGVLDVGPINLTVNHNITINSSQVGSGSIEIYSTAGISNTITSSGGSFTNLTLGGTMGTQTVNVSDNSALTINGTLNLLNNANGATTRYLMIGANALTFGESAAATNAGSTAFVRTNGVASDLGVTKNWTTGTSTFVYPIGTSSNYTPVSYSLNVASAGTLTVVPVNSAHLTYNQGSSEFILNYYWSVKRGSSLNASASGNHTYSFPASMVSGSGGTLLAGYLDPNSNPLGWTTSGHGGSATLTPAGQMTFTPTPTTNFPAAGSYYDYSVGTINTLPNPILPLYSRLATAAVADPNTGGDWTNANSWTADPAGTGTASSIVPNGIPVVILPGARINMATNGKRAYKITINGLLNNETTTGHNLGILSGTGTFRTTTNTFPAGDYTAFVSSSGGTIEYVGPMTMNNRTTYNNLSISGSGSVDMTASNLTINGSVTIASGATLNNNLNSASMTVAGNWTNNGTFNAGTGSADVTFNGASGQSVSGDNTFNQMSVNKSGGDLSLTGTGFTTVNETLTLTGGYILSTTSNKLTLGISANVSGGSASSFVDGPMAKSIGSGSFTAPLGSASASRFRPVTLASVSASDFWNFEYIPHDPTDDGYANTTMNTTNIKSVSQFEYWLISRAGTTSATVTLPFDVGSYIPNPDNIGLLSNLRVAHWDGSQWDIASSPGTAHTQSGNSIAGFVTAPGVSDFSPFTLASIVTPSALPVELISFTGKIVPAGVELNWKTLTEINNDHFTIEKSVSSEGFYAIGEVAGQGTTYVPHDYSFLDKEVRSGKAYYRLKQTDFDGKVTYSKVILIDRDGEDAPSLVVYPNPAGGSEITVEISGVKDVDTSPVTIYDQMGREQFTGFLSKDKVSGSMLGIISVENWAGGVYSVRIGDTRLVTKLVIRH